MLYVDLGRPWVHRNVRCCPAERLLCSKDAAHAVAAETVTTTVRLARCAVYRGIRQLDRSRELLGREAAEGGQMGRLPFSIGALWLMTPYLCLAQVSVLTYHNDNFRTGTNLNEVQLSTSNVGINTFGMSFSYPVDASIYAQPLYVPSVNIPGKGAHNVVYVATMNDSVYAFDADSNAGSNAEPLWYVNFTDPAAGITAVNSVDIEHSPNVSGPVGIMGTPVIDPTSATIYLVARTVESGSYVQRLHALDITSGAEKLSGPVIIQASAVGTGYDSVNGVISFNPVTANQRAALALGNGEVIIAWGGFDDDFDPYHGWVMAYDATTLQQVSVYISTPNGSRGGFWQSGTGIPIDGSGNLYVTSGNGDWDGVTNFGDTMLKLNLANGLSQTDWFTPDNQSFLSSNDLDLGVSGPMLLPGTNLLLGGSKQGILYLLNTSNMGHEVGGNGEIVQSLQAASGEIHSSAYYSSPTLGPLAYLWTAGDYFKAFQFNGSTFGTTPYMQSSFTAPAGNPGGVLSISANGSQAGSGIVWVSMPLDASAETQVVPGVLRAFDASNLANELWDSNKNSARDGVGSFAKFCPPTIANGKVYLATFSNALDVYGLMDGNPDFTLNATPGTEIIGLNVGTGPYTVSVSASNGFAGTVTLSIAGLPTGASAAFSPTSVSASGTSTLTVNLSSATPTGTYVLTLAGTSGSLSHSVVLGLTVKAVAGGLSGGVVTPSGTQNLTSVGVLDWAHWGLASATSFDHKATGGGQISNYTFVGAGSVFNFGNNPIGFTWTDGTPTASTTDSTTGIYVPGQGNGFQITVPADTTKRTLSVYVGVWESQGQMVAHLSDGSAADYVDTTLNNASGTTPGLYTFTYQAVSSGQTLTVTFTQFNNTSGNVTLEAATLAGAP